MAFCLWRRATIACSRDKKKTCHGSEKITAIFPSLFCVQLPASALEWTVGQVWSWLQTLPFGAKLKQEDWSDVNGLVLLGLDEKAMKSLVDEKKVGGEDAKQRLVGLLLAAISTLKAQQPAGAPGPLAFARRVFSCVF